MSLYAFISNIWAGFSPLPPKRRGRRAAPIDPDSITSVNHWFPGGRNKKQPRRLVDTPTASHWPEHRVAKGVVGKGRKLCFECGALVKKAQAAAASGRVSKVGGQRKAAVKRTTGKKASGAKAPAKEEVEGLVRRSLRGRVVEYAG